MKVKEFKKDGFVIDWISESNPADLVRIHYVGSLPKKERKRWK